MKDTRRTEVLNVKIWQKGKKDPKQCLPLMFSIYYNQRPCLLGALININFVDVSCWSKCTFNYSFIPCVTGFAVLDQSSSRQESEYVKPIVFHIFKPWDSCFLMGRIFKAEAEALGRQNIASSFLLIHRDWKPLLEITHLHPQQEWHLKANHHRDYLWGIVVSKHKFLMSYWSHSLTW